MNRGAQDILRGSKYNIALQSLNNFSKTRRKLFTSIKEVSFGGVGGLLKQIFYPVASGKPMDPYSKAIKGLHMDPRKIK